MDAHIKKFIELVRQNNILYNMSHADYKNTKKKILLWANIAQEMETSVDVCKRKWKSLRDSFSRELSRRKPRSGQEAEEVEEGWKYFRNMEFLKEHMKPRMMIGNYCTTKEINEGPNENQEEDLEDRNIFEREESFTFCPSLKMEFAAEEQQIYRENDKCANSASNLVITDVVSLDSSIARTPTNTTKTTKHRQPSQSPSTSTRLSPAFSESKKRKNSVNQLEKQQQSTNDQEPVDELDAFGKYVVAEIRALHDPDAARRVRFKVARFLLDCIESENQMSEFKEETQSYF